MTAIPLVVLIAVAAAVVGLLTTPARYRRIAAGIAVAALGAASLRTGLGAARIDEVFGLAGTASPSDRSFVATGIGLLVLGLSLALVLGFRVPPRPAPPPFPSDPLPHAAEWAVFAIGLGALVSAHVVLVLALLFLAGGLELVAFGGGTARRLVLALALLLLGSTAALLLTIIGPLPATYFALRDGPIGEPAARLAVLVLLLPAFAFLTSWRLLPAAAALVSGLAGTLLTAGVLHWRGIAMPAALAAAGWGVARGRPGLVSSMLGAYGLWSGTLPGRVGGYLLLAAGALCLVRASVRAALDRPVTRMAAAAGGAGLVLSLTGGLEAQVGYTVVLALGGAAILAVGRNRPTDVASP